MNEDHREINDPLSANKILFLSKNIKQDNESNISSRCKKKERRYQSISNDLRKRIIDSIESGVCSRRTASITFNVPYPTVNNIYHRFLKTGTTCTKKREKHKPKKLNDDQIQFLLLSLSEKCSYTVKQLQAKLFDRYNIQASISTVNRALKSFYYNVRRTKCNAKVDITSERLMERNFYVQQFLNHNDCDRTLIFVAETAFQVTMRRFAGRVHNSGSDRILSPSLRTRNKTIMTAMTKNELIYYRSHDGSNDRKNMTIFINDMIGYLLTRAINSAAIIMDISCVHNCQDIIETIEEAGHTFISVPSCSPCFNPVELMFTNWESHLRSKNPANEEDLEHLISTFTGVLGEEECDIYWRSAMDNLTSSVSSNVVKMDYDVVDA